MIYGNSTLLSIFFVALFWGIVSVFVVVFYIIYFLTLIVRYGTLLVVGWSMLIGGLILLFFYVR